jgi:hypothetical protein
MVTARRHMETHPPDENWKSHKWSDPSPRRFEIQSGVFVLQQHCVECGRDFITVPSGSRHAVLVSMFSFLRLGDEVTKRWLGEPCPGRPLPADNEDRQKRIAKQ